MTVMLFVLVAAGIGLIWWRAMGGWGWIESVREGRRVRALPKESDAQFLKKYFPHAGESERALLISWRKVLAAAREGDRDYFTGETRIKDLPRRAWAGDSPSLEEYLRDLKEGGVLDNPYEMTFPEFCEVVLREDIRLNEALLKWFAPALEGR